MGTKCPKKSALIFCALPALCATGGCQGVNRCMGTPSHIKQLKTGEIWKGKEG